MLLSNEVISIISKISPVIGSALAGPSGSIVGYLVSSIFGGKMENPEDVQKKIEDDPVVLNEIKKLEIQLGDLKSARDFAEKEDGNMKWFRPLLVLIAYLALFADIILLYYIKDNLIKQILILFTGVLVLDIRQMHRMYFGSTPDNSDGFVFSNLFKNLFKRY